MNSSLAFPIRGAVTAVFLAFLLSASAQKPEMEKEQNGVKLSVFKVDQKGNPTPDKVWIGALNSNKEAMIVTGIISYRGVKTQVEGKDVEVIYGSKFAQVISGGKGAVVWEREGKDIVVIEIQNLEVK